MSAEPLRVLLVEDEPGHAELARRAFEGRAGDFVVAVAETVDAARAALHGATPPDLVIADWLLPDGEGLDLLRSEPARAMPPVVIMTSHGSERVAVEAIRAGAVDYVVKSEVALADLPHVAERAVRHRRVEEALGDLVAGTAAAGGEALFGELALRLARALRVKYASVAELVAGDRLRTVARCVDGRLVPNVEYPLAGTPCADVLDGSVCHIRDAVADRYPERRGSAPDERAELRRDGAACLDGRSPGHRQRDPRPAPRRGRAPRGGAAGLRGAGGGGAREAAGGA